MQQREAHSSTHSSTEASCESTNTLFVTQATNAAAAKTRWNAYTCPIHYANMPGNMNACERNIQCSIELCGRLTCCGRFASWLDESAAQGTVHVRRECSDSAPNLWDGALVSIAHVPFCGAGSPAVRESCCCRERHQKTKQKKKLGSDPSGSCPEIPETSNDEWVSIWTRTILLAPILSSTQKAGYSPRERLRQHAHAH
jgi:hypothetical protein